MKTEMTPAMQTAHPARKLVSPVSRGANARADA